MWYVAFLIQLLADFQPAKFPLYHDHGSTKSIDALAMAKY